MEKVKKDSLQAWILAARPHTLPASASPVIVGAALAFHDSVFQWLPTLICLFFALTAQIVSNLANDYFDHKKGTDNEERLGPKRAVAEGWISPKKMLHATLGLLAFDCLLGLSLIYYGGWQLIVVGAIIAIFALAYSGGPYPLSYHGLGDVCVLVFFGIVPVGFTYYVQSLSWTLPTTLCGIAMGLVSTNILVANNYRDRETDKASGKKTTIVLFGEKFGSYFYLFNGIIAVLCCQYFIFGVQKCNIKSSYFAAFLPLIYLIPHYLTWKKMVHIGKGKALIPVLQETARNVFVFALLLALGLIIIVR